MRILTLDPASEIGWAHASLDGQPIYGTQSLPKGKMSRIGLALEAFIIDTVKANGITKVYFEEPVIVGKNGFQAIAAVMSKPIVIAMTCERLGVDAIPLPISTWRSEFGVATRAPKQMPNKTSADKAARRKWMKDQTLSRCIQLGFDPKDDNAADALGMLMSRIWKLKHRAAQPDLLQTLKL